MRVTDARGVLSTDESCERDTNIALTIISELPEVSEGLKIEITWSQTEQTEQTRQDHEQIADLDLHLLHPQGDSWGQAPWDCHFANISPDWGAQGDDHNPVFDDVDVEGVAREVILYPNPEPTADTPYRVGVSYYPTAGAELGSVLVTAHVYLHGELVESLTQELEAGQFATPFEIQWSETGDGAVEVIDRVYDEMP